MTEDPQSKRNLFKSKWSKIRKPGDEAAGKNFAFTDDVSDFLKGAQKSPPLTASTRPAQAPRIDVSVAQRWPDANHLQHLSTGEYKVPSPLPVGISRKAKRRAGLVVRFAATHPEVIGHGGDETETPPIHISQARARLVRTQSERRPYEPSFPVEVPIGETSPQRPGIGDRAQTAIGNTQAHANLISAGVFGDRPASRDNRTSTDLDLIPGGVRRTQTSPNFDTPLFHEDEHSYRARRPSIPPRKAVPPAGLQPSAISDNEPLPSQEWNQDRDRPPRALRNESDDSIVRTQQRMRNEEGQAFARAYRLSISMATEPEITASRSHSRASDDSHNSRYALPTADSNSSLPSVNEPTQVSASDSLHVQKRNSSVTNRNVSDSFLHPRGGFPERMTPPVTPPLGAVRSSGLAPKDYIEHFKNNSASRSNSNGSTYRAFSNESYASSFNSPQQQQVPFQQEQPLKLDVSAANLRGPRQDPTAQVARHNTVITREPPNPYHSISHVHEAVPPLPATIVSEQVPPSATREVQDHAETALSHTQALLDNKARAFPQTPVRKVDPMAAKAFDDFSARVNQMKGVFRLTSQKERSDSIPSSQWLLCAFWWFRRAKIELERLFRAQQRGLLTQAHVNMAKAWWILVEVVEEGPALSDSRDSEDEHNLRHHLEALSMWMDRHQLMPPQASLIQGQDTTVWIRYMSFPPDIEYPLGSTVASKAARDVLPLSDSKQYFFYQSMFVAATVSTDDPQTGRARLPCSLSIVRHWTQYRASVIITSQNGLVNVLIGPEIDREKTGPTWYDISWRPKSCTMSVNLPRGLILNIMLDEGDYRSLSTMIEYTRAIDKSFQPTQGETLVYSSQLREAQYSDKTKKQNFPEGMIKKSFIGIFEQVQTEIHANWKRKVHRGYRVMLITPSTSRTLGVVSHSFDSKSPFLFEVPDATSERANSAAILHAPDGKGSWQMTLVFEARQAFNDLLDHIHGTFKAPDEYTKAKLALRSFSAQGLGEANATNALNGLDQMEWREAIVVDRRSARPTTILSESLRVVLSHNSGVIVDRLNLAPGSMLLRLPVSAGPSMTLARRPQLDTTSAVDRCNTATSKLASLLTTTGILSELASLRTYTFTSLPDLHTFEELMTGYTVACDLCPSRFSITRHRMVVSLHKKWEATRVRLQVLTRGESDSQVAVFFEDFPHADAMIFPVKASDAFERVKGFGVKLVEAKFSLPKKRIDEHGNAVETDNLDSEHGLPERVRRRFVNTESLEYREEADDIVVMFESEQDADAFCAALPGTVHAAGKAFSFKRR